MHETRKAVPTPRQFSFKLLIMAQLQNTVKVLPGWSAMGARYIYPVNRTYYCHLKVVEREGQQTVSSEIITGETLMTLTLHSQS